jgi:hypothetical protein
MIGWSDLEDELARWPEGTATLWWRDDDAIEPTAALERMIALSDRHKVPLALATVPKHTKDELADAVDRCEATYLLQHGWRHRNHAPEGHKAAEFGRNRPLDVMLAEARLGFERLRGLPAFCPVFVPPWNRADPGLFAGLAGIGLCGLSGFGPRDDKEPVNGFTRANTHADIIAWKTTRGFVGEEKVLIELIGHLRARRDGSADAGEPTGLLTHHLVHDEACWTFLTQLLARLERSPAVRFLDPFEVFAVRGPA